MKKYEIIYKFIVRGVVYPSVYVTDDYGDFTENCREIVQGLQPDICEFYHNGQLMDVDEEFIEYLQTPYDKDFTIDNVRKFIIGNGILNMTYGGDFCEGQV